jgi:hypothetical protein
MNRRSPQTSMGADILLILVLAKSLLDLHAWGYLRSEALVVIVSLAFALCLGFRSGSIAGGLRNLLAFGTVVAWLTALSAERPDLVLVFAMLAVVMLVVYSAREMTLFGFRPRLWEVIAVGLIALLFAASCSPALRPTAPTPSPEPGVSVIMSSSYFAA